MAEPLHPARRPQRSVLRCLQQYETGLMPALRLKEMLTDRRVLDLHLSTRREIARYHTAAVSSLDVDPTESR